MLRCWVEKMVSVSKAQDWNIRLFGSHFSSHSCSGSQEAEAVSGESSVGTGVDVLGRVAFPSYEAGPRAGRFEHHFI